MVIIGGSGTGKSVTIKCILGLLAPDIGNIEIDGESVLEMETTAREELNMQIGMLFQNAALFDSLPVWENVAFGLLAEKRCSRREARDIANQKMGLVGLKPEIGDLWPADLSVGMQACWARPCYRPRPEHHLFRRAHHGPGPNHGRRNQQADRPCKPGRWRDGSDHYTRHGIGQEDWRSNRHAI